MYIVRNISFCGGTDEENSGIFTEFGLGFAYFRAFGFRDVIRFNNAVRGWNPRSKT